MDLPPPPARLPLLDLPMRWRRKLVVDEALISYLTNQVKDERLISEPAKLVADASPSRPGLPWLWAGL